MNEVGLLWGKWIGWAVGKEIGTTGMSQLKNMNDFNMLQDETGVGCA